MAEELRGPAVQADRQGSPSVRHQPAEGLERVEETVRPREEVHVRVGDRERSREEAPDRTALQHVGLAALLLQHNRDAGHRNDSTEREAKVQMGMYP